jgi:hypothetical protein
LKAERRIQPSPARPARARSMHRPRQCITAKCERVLRHIAFSTPRGFCKWRCKVCTNREGDRGSAKAVAAFAGLSPRERRSGTSIHGRTRLCKTGNARVRKALYMPAMVAVRFNPTLRIFAERLLAAGKHKRLVIGAVMRKLLALAYGILRSGKRFDANYT